MNALLHGRFQRASRGGGEGIIPLAVEPVSRHRTAATGGLALREVVAELCYFTLRLSGWLALTLLSTFGLYAVFFMALGAFSAEGFFAHLANISDRFLGAEQGRQIGFLDEFKFVLIGVATLVVVWRLPRFINDLERELSGEKL